MSPQHPKEHPAPPRTPPRAPKTSSTSPRILTRTPPASPTTPHLPQHPKEASLPPGQSQYPPGPPQLSSPWGSAFLKALPASTKLVAASCLLCSCRWSCAAWQKAFPAAGGGEKRGSGRGGVKKRWVPFLWGHSVGYTPGSNMDVSQPNVRTCTHVPTQRVSPHLQPNPSPTHPPQLNTTPTQPNSTQHVPSPPTQHNPPPSQRAPPPSQHTPPHPNAMRPPPSAQHGSAAPLCAASASYHSNFWPF